MKSMYIQGTLAIAVALFGVGCTETVDSKNIRTAGIAALIDAESTDGTSTTVLAVLKTGGAQSNTYVNLSDGDRLVAEGGGTRKEMTNQSSGEYEAEFATAAADTEFRISLERENDDPAPNSVGKIPAPFNVAAIPTGDHSRAQDLTITWDNSGTSDDMHIEANGSCIFIYSKDIPGDSGSFTITAGDLDSTNKDKPETCNVTLEITRSRNGTADPTYDSESWFHLRQVRTVKFTSAP